MGTEIIDTPPITSTLRLADWLFIVLLPETTETRAARTADSLVVFPASAILAASCVPRAGEGEALDQLSTEILADVMAEAAFVSAVREAASVGHVLPAHRLSAGGSFRL
jgi:hypothetical protein